MRRTNDVSLKTRRRELIQQYVALLRGQDDLLKGLSSHHAAKVDRSGARGRRPKSPSTHVVQKLGIVKTTVQCALTFGPTRWRER